MRQGKADRQNQYGLSRPGLNPGAYGKRAISNPNSAYGEKREPRARAVSEGATGQIGTVLGDHITDGRRSSPYKTEVLYKGRGLMAPMVKSQSRNNGSQGRY